MGLTQTLDLAKQIEDNAANEQNLESIPAMVKQVNEVCERALRKLKAANVEII